MIYKQKVRSFNLLRYSESLIFFSQKSILQLIEHLFRCRCSCCWRRRSRHFNSFRRSSVIRSSFPTLFFFSRCICIGRDIFISLSMNLVGVSLSGKDGVSILSFCFTKSLHSVDFLPRKESYISTLFLFLIVRYIPAIMVNPKILKRYGVMSPRSPVGTKVILGFLKVNSFP